MTCATASTRLQVFGCSVLHQWSRELDDRRATAIAACASTPARHAYTDVDTNRLCEISAQLRQVLDDIRAYLVIRSELHCTEVVCSVPSKYRLL